MKTLNIIGRQVQKLRVANRWTQDVFAKELQKVGLNKSRAGVARIEARLVAVKEYELLFLAKALGVGRDDLYPDIDPKRPLYDVVVVELLKPRKSTAPKWRKGRIKSGKSPRRRATGHTHDGKQ